MDDGESFEGMTHPPPTWLSGSEHLYRLPSQKEEKMATQHRQKYREKNTHKKATDKNIQKILRLSDVFIPEGKFACLTIPEPTSGCDHLLCIRIQDKIEIESF